MAASTPRASAFGTDARLHCQAQIEAVKTSGRSQAGRYSVIVVLKAPPDGKSRAAFLISRRYDLTAVRRNRARRLFREAWRAVYPKLEPCWVLLIPRKAMKGAKLQDVLPELERALPFSGPGAGESSISHGAAQA